MKSLVFVVLPLAVLALPGWAQDKEAPESSRKAQAQERKVERKAEAAQRKQDQKDKVAKLREAHKARRDQRKAQKPDRSGGRFSQAMDPQRRQQILDLYQAHLKSTRSLNQRIRSLLVELRAAQRRGDTGESLAQEISLLRLQAALAESQFQEDLASLLPEGLASLKAPWKWLDRLAAPSQRRAGRKGSSPQP